MQIPSTGREYATWTIAGADTDTQLAVSFDNGQSWHDLDRPTTTTVRLLVAGPTAQDNPDGTVVLAAGVHQATLRAVDDPETVIRTAGRIDVRP